MQFEELCTKITELASKVGFQPGEVLTVEYQDQDFPTALWSSSYAKVLAVGLLNSELSTIEALQELSQERLDVLLIAQEQDKIGPVDGYLILVLPQGPSGELLPHVRRAELDTLVCRKHFTWPGRLGAGSSDWEGILLTTVLGLPENSSTGTVPATPALAVDLEKLLELINEHGAPSAARRTVIEVEGN